MKVLGLDISSSTGWALVEGEKGQIPSIVQYGTLVNAKKVKDYGEYPWSIVEAAEEMCSLIFNQVRVLLAQPGVDLIVIEETNLGKRRTSQKVLEWIHLLTLLQFRNNIQHIPIMYVDTGEWRKVLNIRLTNEDKKMNKKVRDAKRKASSKGTKVDFKALGARGRVGKKHLAIRYVNHTFGLALKVKDDDVADCISLVTSVFLGAKPSTTNS